MAKKIIYGINICAGLLVISKKKFVVPKVTNLKKTLSLLTKPTVVGPSAFIAIGAAKTVKDYMNASENEKTKVLLVDTVTLGGSVAAFLTINPLTKAFCDTEFFNFFIKSAKNILKKHVSLTRFEGKLAVGTKKIVGHTEHIIKQATASTINTLFGIIGAVGANGLIQKYVISKMADSLVSGAGDADDEGRNDKSLDTLRNKNNGYFKVSGVFDKFNYVTPKIVKDTSIRFISTMSDVPEMNLLSAPMIALTGMSVAKIDGYRNKLKKISYELIANTFIPTVFVTLTSIAVENKKPYVKYPALFFGLITGAFLGKIVADKSDKYIHKEIDNIFAKFS